MRIFEWLEEWFVWGARLGTLGERWWGRVVTPLVAIPIILLGRLIYPLSVDVFYVLLFVLLANFFIATNLALGDLPIERYNEIVLPSVAGMMLGFFYIPHSFEMIFWGYITFSGLLYVVPRFLRRYREEEPRLEIFTGITGAFVDEAVSGVFTCILLHMLKIVLR
ncbi:hypothetical protein ACFLY6_02090 [Candidatus Dependentiae bacterium]